MTDPKARFVITADDETSLAFKQVNANLAKLSGSFNVLDRLGSAALGVFSVAVVTNFAKSVFEAADAIGDAAAKFGTSAESLSRLKFAAEQSDVEFQSLTVGIKTVQKAISEAAKGSETAQEKFTELGLSASALRDLSLEDQFKSIAQAFKDVDSPADQTRLAMELFGKAGADLVPLLNQGEIGIDALMRKADELGVTLRNNTAAAISVTDQALKQFKATASGITANFIGNLLLNLNIVELTEPVDILNEKLRRLEQERKAILFSDTGNSNRRFLPGLEEEIAVTTRKLVELQRMLAGGSAAASGPGNRSPRFEVRGPDELSEVTLTSEAVAKSGADKVRAINEQLATDIVEIQNRLAQEQFDLVNQFDQLQKDFQANNVTEATKIFEQSLNDQERINKASLDRRLADEQAHADAKRAVQQSVVTAGINALNAFNTASTKKSKELVAINKAVSIAQAIQNTYVGATKAIAQGGIWGFAQAGAIIAFGLAQVAAIARTNYGSQGASNSTTAAGTSVNPIYTTNSGTQQDQGAQTQRAVQVTFNGPIFSSTETAQWLIDTITEAVSDRDVVFIPSSSRQAQELMPA